LPLSGAKTYFGVNRDGLSPFIRDRIDTVAAGVVADYDYTDAGEIALIKNNYYAGMRQFRMTPGVKSIIRRYQTAWQADDHERPGDDINRDDIAGCNQNRTIVANTAQLGQVMDICREAFTPYFRGNPANSDANRDMNYPDNEQTYFRVRVSDDVELFFLDTTDYKTSEADAAAVRKVIGATQSAWLKTQIEASTATFKIIVSPTPLHAVQWSLASENTDPHPNIAGPGDAGERDVIMQYLDDLTGVVCVAGDLHHACLAILNGVACLSMCPVQSSYSIGINYNSGRQWLRGGRQNLGMPDGQLGFIDIGENALKLRGFSLNPAADREFGTIAAGSNALTTSAGRFS
jgi:hypothetical protein